MTIDPKIQQLGIQELREQFEDIQKQVSYYKRLSDEVAGYNILVDSKIILLKRELQLKNDGFSILSSLHKTIGTQVNLDDLMHRTLDLILVTLKMDKSTVLWVDEDDSLSARWWLGYTKKEISEVEKLKFHQNDFPGTNNILINRKTNIDELLAKLQAELRLPYIVGVPLYQNEKLKGWLVAGREKEAQPFYPALTDGDVFIFRSIGVFLEAAITNIELYEDIEEANHKLANINQHLEQKVAARVKDIAIRNKQLNEEKKKSDDLLLNILPQEVASELKEKGKYEPRLYDNLSIMFTDFVNFTQYSSKHTPVELVTELDYCFSTFDQIIDKYGLEKIKTIGDAYFCIGGLADEDGQIHSMMRAALEIRDFMQDRRQKSSMNDEVSASMQIRIGIHIGPAIAGVVGIKKFAFDIWGDAVNVASRIESHGLPGKVNISDAVYQLIKEDFHCQYRDRIELKNKGKTKMYFVENLKP